VVDLLTKDLLVERIEKHLSSNHESKMNEVMKGFEKQMNDWTGSHRQMDNMLLTGKGWNE
jgi:hypothetical protein